MSSIDTLLDNEISTVSEGESTDNRIILTIDEPSRTIKFDGSLILGVKGDRFAERIYFRAPRLVYDDIDLTAETTKIYIDYINAAKEPYIQESSDAALQEDGTVLFSWHLSEYVTIEKGTVQFNVCVKKVVDTELVNEWHTTYFTGTVLPAVDVSGSTPEVITSESVTMEALTVEVAGYAANVAELNKRLDDADDHIEELIEAKTFTSDNVLDKSNGDVTLTRSLEDIRIQNGLKHLGTFTTTFYDAGNDYLATITTPGVYSFVVKTSESVAKLCLLFVESTVSGLTQTVLTDVNTENMSKHMRYYLNNKWVFSSKKEFAYKDKLGITHHGTYTTGIFDPSNDYLSNIRTPGIYSFNITKDTSNSYNLLFVEKDLLGLRQTVICDVWSQNMFTQYRHMDLNTLVFTEPSEKHVFAFKSDLLDLGSFKGTPFDQNNDYLADVLITGQYKFSYYTSDNNNNQCMLIVSKDLLGTIEQTLISNLYSGVTIQNRTYNSSTSTWNSANTVRRLVFQHEMEERVGWQYFGNREIYLHEHFDLYTLDLSSILGDEYSEFKIVINFTEGAKLLNELYVMGEDITSDFVLQNNIPVLIEMKNLNYPELYATYYVGDKTKTWYNDGSYETIEISLDMGEEIIRQIRGTIKFYGRY